MKKSAANRGFTLIEVIISLAVLSIASVFILQMFVTSSQLNRNARDIDQANAQVSALIESFLLYQEPADFAGDAHFYLPQVDTEGGVTTVTCYFDQDWQPTTAQGSPRFLLRAVIEPREEGPVTAAAFGEGAGDGAYVGRLYSLDVSVFHRTSDGKDVALAGAGIWQYFQGKEALP